MEPNEHILLVGTVVGFILPAIIALLNQSGWSPKLRALVAFVACLVAAVGLAWAEGDLSEAEDVVSAMLSIFVTAIGTYRLWWKPSTLAPSLERVTSFDKGPA